MHSSELGSYLKNTREQMGISPEELEKRTNIWSRYFKEMDNGNFDMVEGEFYRQGFLKQYARQLGLDCQDVMAKYKACYATATPEDRKVQPRVAPKKGGIWQQLLNSIKVFIIP